MSTNLYHLLADHVATRPDAVALKYGDQTLTYGELDEQAGRVASYLAARGLQPGDRVGVMMPNHPAFAVAYYGVLRAGGVVVPMNPLLKAREVHHHLQDPQARFVFVWAPCVPEVEAGVAGLDVTVIPVAEDGLTATVASYPAGTPVVERDPSDTAVILYTSGTTGLPKGAELTHANLSTNAQVTVRLFGLTDQDVVIGALPLFHAFGQTCSLNAVLAAGARQTMIGRFDPATVLEAIQADGATVFMGVPTMYNALLHHPGADTFDTSTLHMGVSGGAALPVEVLRSFESTFGCDLLEGYGLSETSPLASFNRKGNAKPGTIGQPVEGVEFRLVDDEGNVLSDGEVGEIAIRGHNVMKGYWRKPEITAAVLDEAGWFRTGDVGTRDEDGFYTIVDRKKDLIIRGGYNVYPREIEEVLYEHPAVRECAVIGVAHDSLGEEVGAAIVLHPGDEQPTAEEITQYVRSRVAAYKYPRHVWFVAELPKGPTHKILKREIVVPELVQS